MSKNSTTIPVHVYQLLTDQDNCIKQLRVRIAELEGQHKGLVLQNALLRQRPDLPVDRIPAADEVEKLRARIAALEVANGNVDSCEWKRNVSDYCKTDCGYGVEILQYWTYCPYCGRKIKDVENDNND